MMEAHKRKEQMTEKVKKEEVAVLAGLEELEVAGFYYNKWKKDGKQYNDEKVKMTQLVVKAIVKALMPRVDPTKKVS